MLELIVEHHRGVTLGDANGAAGEGIGDGGGPGQSQK